MRRVFNCERGVFFHMTLRWRKPFPTVNKRVVSMTPQTCFYKNQIEIVKNQIEIIMTAHVDGRGKRESHTED